MTDFYDDINDQTFLLELFNPQSFDNNTNISAWGFAPVSTVFWITIGSVSLFSSVILLIFLSFLIACLYFIISYEKHDEENLSRLDKCCRNSKPCQNIKKRGYDVAWEYCDENIYSQMIHKVLFEDDKINWGPAIVQYGYGLFLNISSQFMLTFYLFFTSIIPRYNELNFSQDKDFCNISSLLKFTSLVIFLFTMFSKLSYFYKQVCIIFSTSYRKNQSDDEVKTITHYKYFDRLFLFFICWMTEFIQWCFLLVCGMGYLLFADSVETLIMNSLSLEFILDIDEMIFKVLNPANYKSDQYEIELHYYPPKRNKDTIYNIFQFIGLYFTSFCTKFIAPTLSIISIIYLDDYVGCSYCPNGTFCIYNNKTQGTEYKRVLTSFDMIWPFIIVSFFFVNEVGRLVTTIENIECCKNNRHEHEEKKKEA